MHYRWAVPLMVHALLFKRLLLCSSFIPRKLWAISMIMTRPVSNQLFKGLTVLYSRSGVMRVPVRYLRLTAPVCTVISAFFIVLSLRTSNCILQVVLVTDGSLGIGKGSLRNSLQTLKQRGDDKKFPLPFPFPTKLYIMCVANAEEVTSLLMWTRRDTCTTDQQKDFSLIPFLYDLY